VKSKQSELCGEVLRRLEHEGVLQHVVLIGSWCLLAYEEFFSDVAYHAAIRTRDIDLLSRCLPDLIMTSTWHLCWMTSIL